MTCVRIHDDLDAESAAALAALASCWARKLPRVFRYGALKRHGALPALIELRAEAAAAAIEPQRSMTYQAPGGRSTAERYPAFEAALKRTLRGGITLDDLRATRARTVAERMLDECSTDTQPFLLTAGRRIRRDTCPN